MERSPRERLLDAADVLMYEQGYEAVGVAELCRVADTRKGSFYHFFESKQALALAMIDRSWDRTRTTIFDLSLNDPTLGTIEALQRYGELLVQNLVLRQNADAAICGCRFGNFAVELSTRDEEIRARIAEIFDAMVEIVAGTIDRGVTRGEVGESVDANAAARLIVAHMQGLMVMAKAHREPNRLAELGDFARIVLER